MASLAHVRRPKAFRQTARAALIACALAWLGPAASAQDGASASIRLFDRLCYSTMPDIAAAEALAEPTWQAVTGKDLDAFKPAVEPEVLKAWKFSSDGGSYSLALSKSAMDEQSNSDFPNYAGSTNFACSLILPADKTPPASVAAQLQTLIERKPDASYDEGPWAVSSWSGGNAQLLVLVYHYAPKSGAPGGLLSMSVFQKP